VDEVDIRGAPLGAGLHVDLGSPGVNGFDADPDFLIVNPAFQRTNFVGDIMRDVLVDQHAVTLNNGNGGAINLVHRAGIATRDGVRVPGNGKGMLIVHRADAAGGCDDRYPGENSQNRFIHIKDRATENAADVKPDSKRAFYWGMGGFVGMNYAVFQVAETSQLFIDIYI